MRRQVELEVASPSYAAPAARVEHAARMSEAQVTLKEGRPANMPEASRAAVWEDLSNAGQRLILGDDELTHLPAQVTETTEDRAAVLRRLAAYPDRPGAQRDPEGRFPGNDFAAAPGRL